MGTLFDISDMPSGVSYMPRAQWGLTDGEAKRRGMSVQPGDLPELYWHHTAGATPDMTGAVWDDDPIRFMWHMDQLATSGALNDTYVAVSYSWVIHTAPGNKVTIIGAREDLYPGATKSRNAVSKAICFAGNFHTRGGPTPRRSPRQLELDAARWLRVALIRAGIIREVDGRGHYENPSCLGCTACPGNLLIPHIPYLNSGVVTAPPDPAPPSTGVLPTMYEFRIKLPTWPSHARFRVTAREIIRLDNGPAADVDIAAGMPMRDGGKSAAIALLTDATRKHVGPNPFVGDWADPELHAVW